MLQAAVPPPGPVDSSRTESVVGGRLGSAMAAEAAAPFYVPKSLLDSAPIGYASGAFAAGGALSRSAEMASKASFDRKDAVSAASSLADAEPPAADGPKEALENVPSGATASTATQSTAPGGLATAMREPPRMGQDLAAAKGPPFPAPRPRARLAQVARINTSSSAPIPARTDSAIQPDERSFLQRFFGMQRQSPGQAMAYGSPEDGILQGAGRTGPALSSRTEDGTAIYDSGAHAVVLPNGSVLESHSGLGPLLDDPASVAMKDRGALPPQTYKLSLREAPFHGVRALRLTPIGRVAFTAAMASSPIPSCLGRRATRTAASHSGTTGSSCKPSSAERSNVWWSSAFASLFSAGCIKGPAESSWRRVPHDRTPSTGSRFRNGMVIRQTRSQCSTPDRLLPFDIGPIGRNDLRRLPRDRWFR